MSKETERGRYSTMISNFQKELMSLLGLIAGPKNNAQLGTTKAAIREFLKKKNKNLGEQINGLYFI